MSPKHVEKCNLILMILVLILTVALAFMWRVANQTPKEIVRTVYVEVPVIQYVEKPVQVPLEPEPEMERLELTGADLYISYVDEITSTIYTDVDPLLVKAIIYHESRFDADAVNSKSGTMGLMQVSPKWHTQRAERLGVSLSDPYGNILVGCDILHELYSSNSKSYSLNVYAGGYPYANKYMNDKSPFEKELDTIMQGINDGTIVLGGE